jgi:hypothetical protein
MGIRYLPWGPSRRWHGEVTTPPFAPIRLPDAAVVALDAADRAGTAPKYVGSASKHFDNIFDRFAHGWDNKLLSPDDAVATADWIVEWAATLPADAADRNGSLAAAERLREAARADWYFDWEV